MAGVPTISSANKAKRAAALNKFNSDSDSDDDAAEHGAPAYIVNDKGPSRPVMVRLPHRLSYCVSRAVGETVGVQSLPVPVAARSPPAIYIHCDYASCPRLVSIFQQQPVEQQSVATPQAARGWAHFKIQSCYCLNSAFELAAFRTLGNDGSLVLSVYAPQCYCVAHGCTHAHMAAGSPRHQVERKCSKFGIS
jgi:hypothetical protein